LTKREPLGFGRKTSLTQVEVPFIQRWFFDHILQSRQSVLNETIQGTTRTKENNNHSVLLLLLSIAYGCLELVHGMQYMVLNFNHANYGLTEALGLGAAAAAAAAGELLPSD